MKSVCIVTATRAEYGILKPLIKRFDEHPDVEMRLAVTGTHLSEEFGMTVQEIEKDGFPIDVRIEILCDGDDAANMSREQAKALEGFSAYFSSRRPDMAVLLGDRFETAAIAMAAVNERIPIAHLHGGETTEGAVDECYRHAITKLSYLHFTSCETYRKRVIQMGEAPKRVFNVGSLGVENVLSAENMTLRALSKDLGFALEEKSYAVVTFHPVTLDDDFALSQVEQLLAALDRFPDMKIIFTKANADVGGRRINETIKKYCAERQERCYITASLGMKRYFSALKHAAMVIGNSSSGIVEAPSFKIPTVNIGVRQRGRIRARSAIECAANEESIVSAIEKAMSPEFLKLCENIKNPYEGVNTTERIVKVIVDYLEKSKIDLKKRFYDINF